MHGYFNGQSKLLLSFFLIKEEMCCCYCKRAITKYSQFKHENRCKQKKYELIQVLGAFLQVLYPGLPLNAVLYLFL